MSNNPPPLTYEQVLKIRQKPEIFFKEILGVDRLEDYHLNILDAFVSFDRLAIAATHAVGKTWLTARLALFFLTMYKNSKVITTAPTNRQVKKLLWGELRSAHKKSKMPLGGRMLQTELILNDEWFAMGFAPQKEAGEGKEQVGSSFQGFHANYILIIFDEATGISADVWKMAEGLLTSGKIVKFVCIGNPTTRNCEFFNCFSSYEWKKIHLSCFDSPNMIANNFTDMRKLLDELDYLRSLSDNDRVQRIQNYKKLVPYLLSAQWVISKALDWGVTHPLFLSKALGQFPDEEENVIIQLGDVEKAMAREVQAIPGMKRFIGVDVARFGEDKTVFVEIVGYKNTRVKKLVKKDNTEVVGELIAFSKKEWSAYDTVILIDGTGVGGGVIDIIKEKQRNNEIPRSWEILEMHNAASCDTDEEKSRFANIKAKMYDDLGKDIRDHLQLLDDSDFLAQLPTVKFKFDSKGKMLIESKDDYKKRTGRSSPDEADALALANHGRHVSKGIGRFSDLKDLTGVKESRENNKKKESRIKSRFSH